MPKSNSRTAAPKTSSSAAFSANSTTTKSTQTSILKTAFAPSYLQLSLLASTIRSLESEELRIHDTITGELKNSYTVSGTSINCLVWGEYGRRGTNGTPGKKKKRKLNDSQGVDATSSAVIAIGTRNAEILLFSPLEGQVIATLEDSHPKGARDFVFEKENRAWSLGVDGSLIHWDLWNGKQIQNITAPINGLNKITTFSSSLLLAAQSSYLFDPQSQDVREIPCFTESIHSLIPQPESQEIFPWLFIAAADSQSAIGIYNVEDSSVRYLNAENAVQCLSLQSKLHTSILAAVTEAGNVELFPSPFEDWSAPVANDLKPKGRNATKRSTASIEVRRADKSSSIVSILDAEFDSEGTLVLVVADSSANLGFERMSAVDENGSLAFSGLKTISRAKNANLVNQSMNGVKDLRHAHVDQSRDLISNGLADAIDEDAVEEESSEEELSEEDEEDIIPVESAQIVARNKAVDADHEMAEAEEDEDTEEAEEPTFGDLVKARGFDVVDVTGSSQSLLPSTDGTLSSGLTLGTLLTQALNTNDSASLDTCLAQQDLQVIRGTVERLNSNLALTLLHRLAERLHSRPGRAGSLLVWVQWTIVAHGGYLSSRPDTVQQLRSLHKVVQERAKALQPLLALKGKLDMLDAQIAFRKRALQSQQAAAAPMTRPENMIYVEGQEESDSEDEAGEQGLPKENLTEDDEEEEEEDDGEDIVDDNDDEEDADSEQEQEDEESIVSDENQIDGEVDHDDIDPMSDASEDDYTSIGATKVNGIQPH